MDSQCSITKGRLRQRRPDSAKAAVAIGCSQRGGVSPSFLQVIASIIWHAVRLLLASETVSE